MPGALPMAVPPVVRGAIRGWRPFVVPELFRQMARAVMGDDRALVALLLLLSVAEARTAAALRRLAKVEAWTAEAGTLVAQADVHDAHRLAYAGLADRVADRKSLPRPSHPPVPTADGGAVADDGLRMLSAYLVDAQALLRTDLMLDAIEDGNDPDRAYVAERLGAFRAARLAHAEHHSGCVAEATARGVIDPRAALRLTAKHDRYWWDGVARAGAVLAQASADRLTSTFA